MSTRDFSSDINDWVAIAKIWHYEYQLNRYMRNMAAGLEAVDESDATLASAPSGVGGQISNALESTYKTLDEHKLIMSDFVDSIHYEVAEYIDIPFTHAANTPMGDAYALNPKDFKINRTGFLGIPYSDSLWDLISGMIDDSALKSDLKNKFNNLNNDKISNTLKNIVEDASYWANEFEKAGQIRDIQQEFLDKYETDWENMTPAEREEALNEYAKAIGVVMGNGNDIVGGMKVYNPDRNKTSETGRHIPIIDWNNVRIAEDFLSSASLKDALNLVTHECRHRQQSVESLSNPTTNNARENIWMVGFFDYLNDNNYFGYWENPIEEDARAFAGLASV